MFDIPQDMIWNVPFGRNPFLVGREELLESLRLSSQRLQENEAFQILCISGLAGVGKTQLAIEHAYRQRQNCQAIFWISAESVETLFAGYDEIARAFALPQQDYHEQEVVVQAVKAWLETATHWLLILDNADRPEIFSAFLPRNPRGQILIITRAQNPGFPGQLVSVDPFTPEEGARFLLQRAGLFSVNATLELHRTGWSDLAIQLAHRLEYLPLTLEHAAAHIDATGMNLDTYLQIYGQHRAQLLKQRPSLEYPHTATTISLAFQRLKTRNAAAAEILCLCTFLAALPISEEMLSAGANAAGEHLALIALDPYLLNQAIAELAASALVSRDTRTRSLTVHQSVRQVISLDILSKEKQRWWKQHVVNTISASFPDVSAETWGSCQRLLPHALRCAIWIEEEQITSQEAAHLLDCTGYYLYERERYAGVEDLYRRSLAICEQQMGNSRGKSVISLENLALSLENLALFYKSQGTYASAEALYERALALKKQRYGARHPEVAKSQNSLALLYTRQGKYVEAELLYLQTLAIYKRHLNGKHPDMATVLNNLAILYIKWSRYEKAEPLFTQALEIREQYPGPRHTDMAASLDSLGDFYGNWGKYDKAEPRYKQSLAIREQYLGSEHPDTANSLNNLALLYARQRKYEDAEPFYQRAWKICEQYLGPKHTDTATCLNNLALLYTKQGKYEEAEPLYRQALEVREQVLGNEHPFIATSLSNLAGLYASQGKYAEAKSYYQSALAIDRKAYGEENPEIVTDLNNLASLYMKQDEYEQAELLLKRALDIEKVLASGHPSIGVVFSNLALIQQKKQRYDEAEDYYREGLKIDRVCYGMGHSTVATDLSNLGALLYLRERYKEAEYFFRQALEIDRPLLNESHPRWKLRVENLSHVLMALGREEEATKLRPQAEQMGEGQADSISFDIPERKES
jgi:tetratricopeptide (TPR) repeat protein